MLNFHHERFLNDSISDEPFWPGSKLTRFVFTGDEGIAGETLEARAHRYVIVDRALGVESAGAWTGIAAPFSHASTVAGTLGINSTLGPAVRRTSLIIGCARAGWRAVSVAALGVRAAGRGYAGIRRNRRR